MSGDRRRYRLLLRFAGASLLWERLWPRLWPVVAVGGVFAALALLDLLPMLPGGLHAFVLAAFAAALAWTIGRLVTGLRACTRADARLRLERDSGLAHRPLTALEDKLAAGVGDPGSEALWRLHRQRMEAAARRLRVQLPAPGMAAREPLAMRVLIPLLLIIGLAAGAGDAAARFGRALTPHFAAPPERAFRIDVWITPPAYTGIAPLFLQWPPPPADEGAAAAAAAPRTIEVPVGSTVLAQAAGVSAAPVLTIGNDEAAFTAIADNAVRGYRAEAKITVGDRLVVDAENGERAAWKLKVIPDAPPAVRFVEPPAATDDARLAIHYTAADDYGIAAVSAVLRRTDGKPAPGGAAELVLPLPLATPGGSEVTGTATSDLTAHVWAGHSVQLHLKGEDAAGQAGVTAAIELVLPERTFSHPVAQAVIDARKRLDDDSRLIRHGVAAVLANIAEQPEHFANDTVVSLALAVARSRLLQDARGAAIDAVRAVLWQTALRLEEGDVPAAEERLRQARQRLYDALRKNAGAATIERLVDELQEALNDFLAAVAAELARKEIPAIAPQPGQEVVRSEDLRDLVEMMRELARSGARDRARQLLGELQRILDDVRAGLRSGQATKDRVEAHRLMGALRNLGERQQRLIDETFGKLREQRERRERGESDGRGEGRSGELAADQERLRQRLGDMMLQFDGLLGGIPQDLGSAERAMNEAKRALGEGRLGDALPHQNEAAERLRQSVESAARMLAERLGGSPQMFTGQADGEDDERHDPFGRFGGDFRGLDLGDVEIPDRIEMRRVEEILRELRRRAGESQRPRSELDYIERLLRRF
jgi:uncharacterized protein (TIGR02302 family)